MPDTQGGSRIRSAGGNCATPIAGAVVELRAACYAFCVTRGFTKISGAALFLALSFATVFAHADDTALMNEANAALSQKDYSTAFQKFSTLAQHGSAIAQFNLGAFYYNGMGVQRDEQQAFEWFAKSAAGGNTRALQVIQTAAARGNDNAKIALTRIQPQSASQQPQPPAQSQQASAPPGDDKTLWAEANAALAKKDYNTAFSKFLILAQHGSAIAQFNLGAFYFNGQGVQRDEKQAFDWFAKSAAQGNDRALQVIQNAAAKGNEYAKAAYAGLAQRTAAASPGAPEVKSRANPTTAVTHADSRQSDASASSSFLLGASLGQTRKLEGINNSPSLGLLAGYKLPSNFGLELAYTSLYHNANANTFLSGATPGQTGTFSLNAVSLAGQYAYGLTSNLSLIGNLGIHGSSFTITSSGNASRAGTSHGFVGGVKVQYDLGKRLGIRGGFDTYTQKGGIHGRLTDIGIAMIYRF